MILEINSNNLIVIRESKGGFVDRIWNDTKCRDHRQFGWRSPREEFRTLQEDGREANHQKQAKRSVTRWAHRLQSSSRSSGGCSSMETCSMRSIYLLAVTIPQASPSPFHETPAKQGRRDELHELKPLPPPLLLLLLIAAAQSHREEEEETDREREKEREHGVDQRSRGRPRQLRHCQPGLRPRRGRTSATPTADGREVRAPPARRLPPGREGRPVGPPRLPARRPLLRRRGRPGRRHRDADLQPVLGVRRRGHPSRPAPPLRRVAPGARRAAIRALDPPGTALRALPRLRALRRQTAEHTGRPPRWGR